MGARIVNPKSACYSIVVMESLIAELVDPAQYKQPAFEEHDMILPTKNMA